MILHADARAIPLADKSVHCVVTSPPYWGLRDYGIPPSVWGGDPQCEHEWETSGHGEHGHAFCGLCGAWRGCYGLEPTPGLYVEHTVEIFREVWRVLRDDGTCWLNLGDCYATGAGKVGNCPGGGAQGARWKGFRGDHPFDAKRNSAAIPLGPQTQPNRMPIPGLKPKDLVGVPWRVAFALQADGWYLRSDVIWAKPNPMPESVGDRPTKAHEYIFLLTKAADYFWDAEAVKVPLQASTLQRGYTEAYMDGKENRKILKYAARS